MRPHRQESVPEISDLFKSVPKTDHRLPLIDSAERNSVRGRTPSLTAAKVSKVAEMVDFIDCSRYLPSTRCCIDMQANPFLSWWDYSRRLSLQYERHTYNSLWSWADYWCQSRLFWAKPHLFVRWGSSRGEAGDLSHPFVAELKTLTAFFDTAKNLSTRNVCPYALLIWLILCVWDQVFNFSSQKVNLKKIEDFY